MNIIDFHTHTFPDPIAEKTIFTLSNKSKTKPFLSSKTDDLILDGKRNGINLSVILPVVTNPLKTEKINDSAKVINDTKEGVLSFGGVHPDTPSVKEEIRRIASMGLKGIKIHPAYQQVPLNDIRFKRIVSYAAEEGLIVLSHGGIDIGVEGIFASPKMCREVVRETGIDKFVMAHMGGWAQWNEVKDFLVGENVYFDTAFCYGEYSYLDGAPKTKYDAPMDAESFVELVKAHGADKILFGTDSPWTDRKTQIELFSALPLTTEEKELIFSRNASKLLNKETL